MYSNCYPIYTGICGSTRFADDHAIQRWNFEQTGEYICLMINYLPGWYAEQNFGKGEHDHFGEASGLKDVLDELHFRKIDLCDLHTALEGRIGGFAMTKSPSVITSSIIFMSDI